MGILARALMQKHDVDRIGSWAARRQTPRQIATKSVSEETTFRSLTQFRFGLGCQPAYFCTNSQTKPVRSSFMNLDLLRDSSLYF